VEVETASGVTRHDASSREDVARVVAGMVERGEQVYAVRPLASTLEDAYVEAIGDEPAS
jgi:phage-related minor tail protein